MLLQAQGENNNWHFGQKMSIDFNLNPPQLQESNIRTNEGCSAVSDAAGNLLFYTMGCRVWDRNGNEMPNSTGLLGNGPIYQVSPIGSSAYGVVIVPDPADVNRYYIFSGDALEDASYQLHYSLVDMTLNGGMGDIVPSVKNVLLMNNVSEYLSSTRGGDCNSYWLIARTQSIMTREFYAFKIDQSGVAATPVITVPPQMAIGAIPHTCFAPDGVTMASAGQKLVLSKFNNVTGEVYDFIGIDSVPMGPVAFSPDASKVYVAANNWGVKQVDLSLMPNTVAVAASVINVDSNNNPNGLVNYNDVRLGPDGKIYIIKNTVNMGFDISISGISNPNVAGTACNFVPSVFNMPAAWLPPPPFNSFFTLGTPVMANPVPDSVYHPAKDTLLCAGSSLQLESSDEDAVTFEWSTGATTATLTVSQGGLYWVRAANHCNITTDTFRVEFTDAHIDLGQDTTICSGDDLVLNAYDPAIGSYLWSNGTTDPAISIAKAGTYSVTATAGDCILTDTIVVAVVVPELRIPEGDTTICSDQQLLLHAIANPESSYLWNTGATGASLAVSAAGTYSVTAENKCGTYRDSVTIAVQNCDCRIFIPNSFSPNGDGKNDTYGIRLACNANAYNLTIYNRYGQRLFQTSDQGAVWDGTFKGSLLDLGTYFYYIRFKDPLGVTKEYKGDIVLIR